MPNTLLVIVAARISEWSEKGEIPPSYLNPSNGFSRIIVLSLVSDTVAPEVLRTLCGSATVSIRYIPLLSLRGFAATFFLPTLVQRYILRRLHLTIENDEKLAIRAYGDTFAGMVAAILGSQFNCTSVASIHTTHLHAPTSSTQSRKQRLLQACENVTRTYTHAKVDYLAPVYSPALETISPIHSNKVHLIPNAVAVQNGDIKSSYQNSEIFNLITVGRLIKGKSVLPVLEGLIRTPDAKLTIVGDGPDRSAVMTWIERNKISHRVKIIRRLENRLLVQNLKSFDAFVGYTEYSEVPKTVIEAGLIGLPIILNTQLRIQPDEYKDAPILWVDGSALSYKKAIEKLHANASCCEEIGRKTRMQFELLFDPALCSNQMFRLLTGKVREDQNATQEK